MSSRLANLLGALALGVDDRVRDAMFQDPADASLAAALVVLSQEDDASIRRLSHAVRLSHPATVRLVDRLEADGLAIRKPGRDARSRVLRLTAKGRKQARAMLVLRQRVLEDLVRPLTSAQRSALENACSTLLSSMAGSQAEADALCRYCDERACDLRRCPVECAQPGNGTAAS